MEELQTLIANARCGEPRAFEQLVRRYQGMAWGLAYSVLGDFHLAEDAAQEAFVEVHRRLGDLRDPAAFPGWLRRIVISRCTRATRRKRIDTASLESTGEPVAGGLSPAQSAERNDLRERVLDSVRALPEKQRVATTLFYIGGYSQSEAAEFLEVPLTTLKKRLHDARKNLAAEMTDMVEEALNEGSPGDKFAERVAEAIEVYSRKGPEHDLMASDWHRTRMAKTSEIQRMGEDGFRVALELSRAEQASVRREAAINFGLCGDPRSKPELLRLMGDPNGKVRRSAINWYAVVVHPSEDVHGPHNLHHPAESVGDGVERLFPALDDEIVKHRCDVVRALGAYVGLGDERVDAALTKALDDDVHKVRHMAARMLGIECPGCGVKPEPFEVAEREERE